MISYVLPTRDRPERLKNTLRALSTLGDHADAGGAEVIVVDNASTNRLILPLTLESGVPVRSILLPTNEGAAARNHGAAAADAASEWIVMLDDDSYPDDTLFMQRLMSQPRDVGAVSADIWLCGKGDGQPPRESGGLPEVFIGCGVAVRRELFLRLGGYDPSFSYYVEEYDLCAKLLLAGSRVVFDPLFSVTHAKDTRHRDMNTILSRLVRNNGWVAQRYAPDEDRLPGLREVRRRYRRIAVKERAVRGFGVGLVQLRQTLKGAAADADAAGAVGPVHGLAAVCTALQAAYGASAFRSAAIIDQGKNAWVVVQALEELGVRVLGENEDAEVAVIGTMSPGPMLDAAHKRTAARIRSRVLMPWLVPCDEAVEAQRTAA